jgi:hypothetical protein
MCEDLVTHWPALQQELTDDLNLRYPFFEGASFRQKLLGQWLIEHDVRFWPLTPTGKLKTDAETLRAMAARCSAVAEFCHSKITLNQLKSFELSVGDDGRSRCMLSAFASKTSRNQPSNTAFAFGLNAAFRSLIKPAPGQALVYFSFCLPMLERRRHPGLFFFHGSIAWPIRALSTLRRSPRVEWIATPSPWWTLTTDFLPVSRGTPKTRYPERQGPNCVLGLPRRPSRRPRHPGHPAPFENHPRRSPRALATFWRKNEWTCALA